MRIKVKKGLERELRLFGMSLKFAYLWGFFAGISFLILFGMILQLSKKDSSTTFPMLILTFIGLLAALLVLKFFFTNLSVRRRKVDAIKEIHVSNII